MKNSYKLRSGLAALFFAGITSFNAQQSYTFTTAGASGRFGPSQTQVTNSYSNTNLAGSVTVSGGIQSVVLPPGVYRIDAFGARGGTSTLSPGTGGAGARMRGDFTLTATSTVNILVGQMGEDNGYNTGGGGGTFVWVAGQTLPLVVAGGGGGGGYGSNGIGSPTTTSGAYGVGSGGTPGTNGNGANAGGGGWFSDGTSYMGNNTCNAKCSGNSPGLTEGGASPFTTIVYHGCAGTDMTGDGGFGGGSGGNGWCTSSFGGGGGGGYSGGVGQSAASSGGGGGGSYNAGTNQINTAATNTTDGKVIITELCSVKISSSSSGTVSPSLLCAGQSLTLTTDAVSNYTWSSGQQTNAIVVAPTTNTVYTVIGTSSANCMATGVMSVIVTSAAPVIAIANPSSNICLGKTVSLTASGAITYTWMNAGVVNGQTFTPNSTAIYTVAGQNGCGITTGTTAITVAPLPVATQASSTTLCQGSPATLTAISAATGFTWMPGSFPTSVAIVAPTANTIYTVTASDGTCSGTGTIQLTTKTTPTIVPSMTLTNICQGQSVSLSASGADPGGTYVWTPGGAGQSVTVSPMASTAVTVAGTNTLNCMSIAQVIVLVTSSPPLTIAADRTLVCAGEQAVLTGTGAANYQWDNGPATAVFSVTPSAALTVYTLTGSHNTNTCTATKTIAVAAIIPNVTLSSSLAICQGASVTFTATGADTYTWNGFDTGSSGNYQTTPASSGVFTLVAGTSSDNVTCYTTHEATVTVNPLPTVSVTPAKETICKGETHTLTATGGVTYSWSGSTSSAASITVSPTSNTIYSVTAIDGNGCTKTMIYTAKVSNCNGINEAGATQQISVYPNPNNGEFVVKTATDIVLRVVNNLGQEVRVLNLNGSNNHTVQIKDLSSGVYYIIGENGSGKIEQKVIITK